MKFIIFLFILEIVSCLKCKIFNQQIKGHISSELKDFVCKVDIMIIMNPYLVIIKNNKNYEFNKSINLMFGLHKKHRVVFNNYSDTKKFGNIHITLYCDFDLCNDDMSFFNEIYGNETKIITQNEYLNHHQTKNNFIVL